MCKFAVKERGENQPCFVAEEEGLVYFDLRRAGDLAQAKEVAAFLNRQIKKSPSIGGLKSTSWAAASE